MKFQMQIRRLYLVGFRLCACLVEAGHILYIMHYSLLILSHLSCVIVTLQEWVDEFLIWDPDSYEGIEHLMVPTKEIWIPDITLYEK